jgi:hypothetical protein
MNRAITFHRWKPRALLLWNLFREQNENKKKITPPSEKKKKNPINQSINQVPTVG